MSSVDLFSAASDCTAIAASIGEPLLPSAPERVLPLLLVEDPGPWPEGAVTRSRWLPPGFWPATWEDHQVRVQLIRRPGRRDRNRGGKVFLVWPGGPQRWIETFTIEDPAELAALDLAAFAAGQRPGRGRLHPDPLLLACTHGSVDRCCARYGRKVAAALAATFPALTWETTHVGGCRFAANLVIAPELAYYGRLTPEAAVEVVHRHLDGRITPAHLRGHAGLPVAAQVALAAVRDREQDDATEGVTVADLTIAADGAARVTVVAPGGRHTLTVAERPLATTAYGCGHADIHTWTRHVVVRHDVTRI